MVPETYEEVDFEMSNFDGVIDNGFEDAIVGKETFGTHSAWNFNGVVYCRDGKFYEDVWRYCSFVETIFADTLEDLMNEVNDKFGWD